MTAATEDAAYSYTATASDVDVGDTVTLTGTTILTWMSFSRHYRRLTGTPTNSEVGSHAVTITATDAAGATATDTFTVVVANTNDAPTRERNSRWLNCRGLLIQPRRLSNVRGCRRWGHNQPQPDRCPQPLSVASGTISGTVNADVGTHTITVTRTDVAGIRQ